MQNWTLASIVLAGSIIFRCSLSPEALATPRPGDPPDPAPRGPESLRGEWVCIYWNYEGISSGVDFEARPADPWLHPFVSGDTWSWRPDPKSPPVLYSRISAGDDGRTVDLATIDRKESLRGIYDIRGDLLRICLSTDRPGVGRPTDFTILPFEKEVTLTYCRVGVEAADARQSQIACVSEAIVADAATSKAFSKLSLDASSGRIAVPAFDVGAPHFDSALLERLRASIGVVRGKVVASTASLNNLAYSYVARAQERLALFDRLVGESRAAARAKMKKREEAAPGRPPGDKP